MEHLTQVIVTVDALHRWPRHVRCLREDPVHQRGEAGEFVDLRDRRLEASAHLVDDRRAGVVGGRRSAQGVGEDAVHLRRRLAEQSRRPREVGALVDGDRGHPPRVLHAGQELLGEGQVDGLRRADRVPIAGGVCRQVPLSAHRADHGRHPLAAGFAQRGLQDDVGVLARGEHPEDLDDHRAGGPVAGHRVDDDRRVRLFAGQDARRTEGEVLGPRGGGHPDVAVIDRVRLRRTLGVDPASHELEELLGIDRVVGAVIDPPLAKDAVLRRADQSVLELLDGSAAIGQRHLIGHRTRARVVPDDQGLDAHLTSWITEPPGVDPSQLRLVPLRGIPPLRTHPRREQLQFRGADVGSGVDLSHGLRPSPEPARTSRGRRG